jgi:hypothetical protein
VGQGEGTNEDDGCRCRERKRKVTLYEFFGGLSQANVAPPHPGSPLASLFTTMYSSRFYLCPSTISYDDYGFDAPPLRKSMQSIFNIHKPTLSISALNARLICLVQKQAVQAILSLQEDAGHLVLSGWILVLKECYLLAELKEMVDGSMEILIEGLRLEPGHFKDEEWTRRLAIRMVLELLSLSDGHGAAETSQRENG